MQIVLLSGRIRAGKSTLGDSLRERYGARVVKTRELIVRALPNLQYDSREDLQRAGDLLDRDNGGEWVAEGLYEITRELGDDSAGIVVVDSVRIASQIEKIRDAYKRAVVHVHLTVSPNEAESRLAQSSENRYVGVGSYAAASQNPTEAKVEELGEIADIRIDTERDRPEDVLVRVAAQLGLVYVAPASYVDALVGGQYGSEGKGHIAWHLARGYDFLVRVGGPNAGHQVPTLPNRSERDGVDKPFTFHVLPSGTGESSGKIIIGPGAVLSLLRLEREIGECRIESERLFIDEQAMIIADEDIAFEEASIKRTIASTAQGVGYATARRVMRGALGAPVRLARDVEELRPYIARTADILERAFREGKRIFIEGTQGSALSLYHGYYPHVTSRDTNVGGLLAESGVAAARLRRVILVVRTYPIRVQDPDNVGSSGPMSRELDWDEIARRGRLDPVELRTRERTSTTNRPRRVGEFDWVLLRRAVHFNAPTDIALTFADYLDIDNYNARRFEQLSAQTQNFIEELERVAGAPVSLISTGFTTHSIIDRRNW